MEIPFLWEWEYIQIDYDWFQSEYEYFVAYWRRWPDIDCRLYNIANQLKVRGREDKNMVCGPQLSTSMPKIVSTETAHTCKILYKCWSILPSNVFSESQAFFMKQTLNLCVLSLLTMKLYLNSSGRFSTHTYSSSNTGKFAFVRVWLDLNMHMWKTKLPADSD